MLLLACLLFYACAKPHEHELYFIEPLEATCTQNGYIGHWECACGKYFSDENGEHELQSADVVLQRLSHSYTDIGYTDTEHYKMCAHCHLIDESTRHEHFLYFEADETTHYRYCSFCDFKTDPEPHVPDGEDEYFCAVCRYRRPKFTLSDDGSYYICSGATKPFKDGVKELDVPDTYENLPVKEIGERAFDGAKFEKVTLGSNIITVGDYAFINCPNITEVVLNDRLLEIKSNVFKECVSLETITLPSRLKILGNHAFAHCIKLKSITIPKGVTRILNNTFYQCTALEEVVLHDGIVSFETAAFCESGIKSFTVPPKVTEIPQTMFLNCPELESVTLPAGITSIGMGAFMNCPKLETIYFQGTEQQWNNIAFGQIWDRDSDFNVVFSG